MIGAVRAQVETFQNVGMGNRRLVQEVSELCIHEVRMDEGGLGPREQGGAGANFCSVPGHTGSIVVCSRNDQLDTKNGTPVLASMATSNTKPSMASLPFSVSALARNMPKGFRCGVASYESGTMVAKKHITVVQTTVECI
eukprot:scaffold128_cov328-Pavlova_lutheri.AAC.34